METTKLIAIIGKPLGHSLSPSIHNACFNNLGMNWRYIPLEIDEADVGKIVTIAKRSNLAGLNVTMPYKETVVEYLDDISDEAKEISAVNTIKIEGTRAVGFNTDVVAIGRTFENNIKAKYRSCAVVGAGGVAKAAISAMALLGVRTINCVNRSDRRKAAVSSLFENRFPEFNFISFKDNSEIKEMLINSDIIINATPIGMSPDVEAVPFDTSVLRKGQIVCDLIYNPPVTRLLKEAEEKGAIILNGLDVFIGQAVESFKIWTGTTPSKDLMLRTVKESLSNKWQ